MMAVESGKVYADNEVLGSPQLVSVPISGGTPEVVRDGKPRVGPIVGREGVLYAWRFDDALERMPVAGGAITTIDVTGFGLHVNLAIDDSGVYWLDQRMSCVLTRYFPSTGKLSSPPTCLRSRDELRVIRAPRVF